MVFQPILRCGLVVFVGWSLSTPTLAGPPEKINCESYGGKLETCEIDTRNGIKLRRRLSKDACVEGQSFGIFRRDVMWVDRGCRGQFVSLLFGQERFSRPGEQRPSANTYRAKPWVNPDKQRRAGSSRKTPRQWAYLAGRLYGKNQTRGVPDPANLESVKKALRRQGVDPYGILPGGLLRDDFVRGYSGVLLNRR